MGQDHQKTPERYPHMERAAVPYACDLHLGLTAGAADLLAGVSGHFVLDQITFIA